MKHIYQGRCPDEWQPESFDPECPACQRAQAEQAELERARRVRALLSPELLRRAVNDMSDLAGYWKDRGLRESAPSMMRLRADAAALEAAAQEMKQ